MDALLLAGIKGPVPAIETVDATLITASLVLAGREFAGAGPDRAAGGPVAIHAVPSPYGGAARVLPGGSKK